MDRRAIGIVRVSQAGGREGESFRSPGIQLERIGGECERLGLDLLRTHDEVDVSGGLPLAKRRGLYPAVQAIEAGEAEVLVVAYFDRLVRNIGVQQEVVDRVEAAGGQVLTVDFGQVSHATATQWLTASQMGLINDYVRRASRERSMEAQAEAIAKGVLPFRHVPPGLRRTEDRRMEPDPETAPLIRLAYELRAQYATVETIRQELGTRGLVLSYIQVRNLLKSRIYLGELHYGDYPPNLNALEPVVDRTVWQQAQRVVIPRGRRAKSQRLLARLGVLRCGTCAAAMVVGTGKSAGRTTYFYRCGRPSYDCPQSMNISATLAEDAVTGAVRKMLGDSEGRASAARSALQAVAERDKAQEDLSAAIRAFAGLEDEEATRERLTDLRAIRDDKQARVDQLGGETAALTVTMAHWDHLSLEGRRGLIRALVERVDVGPGRGVERLLIVPFGE